MTHLQFLPYSLCTEVGEASCAELHPCLHMLFFHQALYKQTAAKIRALNKPYTLHIVVNSADMCSCCMFCPTQQAIEQVLCSCSISCTLHHAMYLGTFGSRGYIKLSSTCASLSVCMTCDRFGVWLSKLPVGTKSDSLSCFRGGAA